MRHSELSASPPLKRRVFWRLRGQPEKSTLTPGGQYQNYIAEFNKNEEQKKKAKLCLENSKKEVGIDDQWELRVCKIWNLNVFP